MNVIRSVFHGKHGKTIIGSVTLLALSLSVGMNLAAASDAQESQVKRDQSTITTGSGERFQTTVSRQTEGTLSAQDLHQVSLLGSRIINHLNEATEGLIDQDPSTAKSEFEKARRLTEVVRELLPVTTVTTVVTDASGEEVYRDVDKVQDDKIALFEGMIALEVVEPILDAKSEAAALNGVRLADADVIHTSMLADLSYIERKLNRAAALFEKPDQALAELMLAQVEGVELSVNKVDDPLVEVQQALRLSERMVEEGHHEAARENLRIAQFQLGTYRSLLGAEDAEVVQALADDIAALMPKTEGSGAASQIRGFWERAVSWFQQSPGQADIVTGTADGSAGMHSEEATDSATASN
ncbi:MAG: hypothetical protein WBG92_23685 [Thiohalocapsa sp.]